MRNAFAVVDLAETSFDLRQEYKPLDSVIERCVRRQILESIENAVASAPACHTWDCRPVPAAFRDRVKGRPNTALSCGAVRGECRARGAAPMASPGGAERRRQLQRVVGPPRPTSISHRDQAGQYARSTRLTTCRLTIPDWQWMPGPRRKVARDRRLLAALFMLACVAASS